MPQCKAVTTNGSQCLRNAHPTCGGYCHQHFNKRPRLSKGAITARQKAVHFLLNSGKLTAVFISSFEITQKIIEIAGPFLSGQEIHTLKVIGQAKRRSEFYLNTRLLVKSLSSQRLTTIKRETPRHSKFKIT